MYKAKVHMLETVAHPITNGGIPQMSIKIVTTEMLFYEEPTREAVAETITFIDPPRSRGRWGTSPLRGLPNNQSLNFTTEEVTDV